MGGGVARHSTRRRPLRTGAPESGAGAAPLRGSVAPRLGAGVCGRLRSTRYVISEPGEEESKVGKKSSCWGAFSEKSFGLSQKPTWVLDSCWKKLSKRCLSPPLNISHPGPHPSLPSCYLPLGAVKKKKRPLGGCPSRLDGPGGTREQAPRPRGLGFHLYPGAPPPRLPAPWTPPSHCRREWRGRAEREDGVTRGGARGPGRGAGESQPEQAREVRERVGRGGRRVEGGEPSGAGSRRRPRPCLS